MRIEWSTPSPAPPALHVEASGVLGRHLPAAVVLGRQLHILAAGPSVRLFIFDSHVGELHMAFDHT